MNRRPLSRPLALLAALVLIPPAFLLRPQASRAQGSPAAASASGASASAPGASASASASASTSASARSAPPLISDDPPPPEKSKAPSLKEWKDESKPVAFHREMPVGCSARRVREWVRMTCTNPAAMIAIVAGPSEGFSAGVSPLTTRADESNPGGWGGGSIVEGTYHLQFPVRRGERRVFEITETSIFSDGGFHTGDTRYVSVSWLADEDPVIVMHRPP